MRPSLLILAVLCLAPLGVRAGETPSEGPPWHRNWLETKAEALREGRPIFAYFTKKH